MSEKQEKTVESIQQEYTQLCARAGHVQYQLHTLTQDLEQINLQLRDLNLEAAKIAAAKKSEGEVTNG